MNGERKHFYQFKSFRLNVTERQLLHNGNAVPLTPKAFDVLAVLVGHSGHLVEKEELLKIVWADSFVEEANIPRIVHTLRKALGEDENGNKFIETVAKKGYRFVAKVTEVREPVEQKFPNEKPNDLNFVEKPAGNELQIPPPEIDETDAAPKIKTKHRSRIMLFGVVFLFAVFLIFLLSFNYSSKSSVNSNEIKSIAVLPVHPLAVENRDAIYQFGIADALILKLSAAKNLRVRPLSAMQRYTDAPKDAVAVGQEQKVDYVLASNYQIAGDKIRITSQLINVSTGAAEDVFKDEQTISNIFALQDAVAANFGQKILTKLNRESNNPAPKRFTGNEEAYRLYLLGRALADRRNRKDAEKAVEYLEQAVRLDPNYALAYAWLANAHQAVSNFGGDRREQYLKQKAAIEKALAIDENLPDAYAHLGEMKLFYEWDFDGAERAMKKAVELDPNSSNAHRMYGLYLNAMGRFDEAIAEIKFTIDLEPASVQNHRLLGYFLFFARRYDESIAQDERVVQMDPSFRTAYGGLINAYKMKGEDDKAFEWFLRAPHRKDEPAEKVQLWKTIYARSGWRGIIEQQIEDAKQKDGEKDYWGMALLYAELGDKEQAIVCLEKAFSLNQGGVGLTILKIDPRFDLIRDDPRFEAIIQRIGLK